MLIQATNEFRKRFSELPLLLQKKFIKQLDIFKQTPFHTSLHTEKLQPKQKQIWSFRIDQTYRVLFRYLDDGSVILLTVGHHGWIYRF
jgi:toxin HigB-1